MDWQLLVAIVGVAGAVGGFVGWLLPSPKDRERDAVAARDEVRSEHQRRLRQVEIDHKSLETRYIESNAKLGAKVDNLASAVQTLSVDVRELTGRMSRHDAGLNHIFK